MWNFQDKIISKTFPLTEVDGLVVTTLAKQSSGNVPKTRFFCWKNMKLKNKRTQYVCSGQESQITVNNLRQEKSNKKLIWIYLSGSYVKTGKSFNSRITKKYRSISFIFVTTKDINGHRLLLHEDWENKKTIVWTTIYRKK